MTKQHWVTAALILFGLILIIFIDVSNRPREISLDDLPAGTLTGTFDSPHKHWTIKTYVCSGDLTDDAVRAAVRNNDSKSSGVKNIYWEYHCWGADVVWLDEYHARINTKTLNVETDSYDWRRNPD